MNNSYGWGLELELPLIHTNGKLLYIGDFDWNELNNVLNAASPSPSLDLKPKYPGHDNGHYYLEGFDIYTDDRSKIADLKVKGVEMRTGVHASINGALGEAQQLFANLQRSLRPLDMQPIIFGCHPEGYAFQGEQGGRTFDDWKAAEVTMITAGLHVNLSVPTEYESQISAASTVQRSDFYGPVMSLFSLNSPFLYGQPWLLPGGKIGKSSRSFLRSFYRHVLTMKPGAYGTRYHFSAFDMVHSLKALGAFAELSLGVLLSDEEVTKLSRTVRAYNTAEVAKYGFDAKLFDGNVFFSDAKTCAKRLLDLAYTTLERKGLPVFHLPMLESMLENQRLFADDALKSWKESESFTNLVSGFQEFSDAKEFNKE